MEYKKEKEKRVGRRSSRRLAEQARQEMLKARKAAHGGHEVGDTSTDPLVLTSEDKEMETPPLAMERVPENQQNDDDYVLFLLKQSENKGPRNISSPNSSAPTQESSYSPSGYAPTPPRAKSKASKGTASSSRKNTAAIDDRCTLSYAIDDRRTSTASPPPTAEPALPPLRLRPLPASKAAPPPLAGMSTGNSSVPQNPHTLNSVVGESNETINEVNAQAEGVERFAFNKTGTTTSYKRHQDKCAMRKKTVQVVDNQTKLNFLPSDGVSSSIPPLHHGRVDMEVVKESIANWIMMHEHPFTLVEEAGFNVLMKQGEIISRNFSSGIQLMKIFLGIKDDYRCCLVTDIEIDL
nr:zinc finger BED domain-containing protein RICESLEEPER 2-like [Ipomoea batatas]